MIFLLLLGAYGKLIEKHFSLEKPKYVGKFSGNEVTVMASCRIDVENSIEEPILLQLWVLSEKVNFECGLEYSSNIQKLTLPATDEWSEDFKLTYNDKQQLYFYLSDCEHKMNLRDQVIVQLDIQDAYYEHHPIEYANTPALLGAFLVIHLIVIFLAIFGIYQDTHEEIPLVFIFIISLVYIVSIVFHLLSYWIYGMDGSGFKFILMFCKFFETFSRTSLLGILLLVTSEDFDPKEFYISGWQFLTYFCVILLEFSVEVVAILRYEVMESIQAAIEIEAIAVFIIRIGLFVLAKKNSHQKLGSRIDALRKAAIPIQLLVFVPVINCIVFMIVPNTGKFGFLYMAENVVAILALFYLLIKFMGNQIDSVLPTKKHKT